MKKYLLAILVSVLWIGPSVAGPNDGGVLVLHHDPELIYTMGVCDSLVVPSDCSELNPTATADGSPQLWFVLAAFPDSLTDRFNTVTFGLGSYDDTDLVIGAAGPCETFGTALEISSAGWPGPNSGTAVSWAPVCGSGSLVPVYWFLTYAYASGAIPLGDYYPNQGSAFVSCNSPPAEDTITEFGTMGFGVSGQNPCPGESGGDGPLGGGEEDGPDFPGDDPPEDPPSGSPLFSKVLSLSLDAAALTFDPYESDPLPIQDVTFHYDALREALLGTGALTLQKSFPGITPADTLGLTRDGDPVRLIDLSQFYHAVFETESAAAAAVADLLATEGVRHAELVSTDEVPVFEPNDPLFDYWDDWLPEDAQWHLQNDGAGNDGVCGDAVAGYDMNLRPLPFWSEAEGDSNVVIGIVDVGVFDDCPTCQSLGENCLRGHPDLRVINKDLADPTLVSRWDDSDFCGDHGTKMASVAAALTNNSTGVAGVCPDCSILDIAVPSCLQGFCRTANGEGAGGCTTNDEPPGCGAVVGNWNVWVEHAITMPLPQNKRLLALNCSFGAAAAVNMEKISVLWNAHLMGIATAAVSGGTEDPVPGTNFPSDVPFVLGVGGYNYKGQYWEVETDCPFSNPGIQSNRVGWRNISVCAPNTPPYVGGHPWIRVDPNDDYYTFTGAGSAATAMVAGTIGILQAVAYAGFGQYLSADDVTGIIEGTALPFAEDPWDPVTYNRLCQSCEPEEYGKGRVNVGGAVEVVTQPYLWDERNFTYETVSITPTRDFQIPGDARVWAELKVEATTAFGLSPATGGDLPEYVGWVRKATSNTYVNYREGIGNIDENFRNQLILQMAEAGIHDCYMTRISETGSAMITGFLYGYYDGEEELVYEGPNGVPLTAPEDVLMSVVNFTTQAVAVDESYRQGRSALSLQAPANPLRVPCQISYSAPVTSALAVSIIDVTGRRLRGLVEGRHPGGPASVLWDGDDERGNPVPSGVYWVQLSTDQGNESIKAIIVR